MPMGVAFHCVHLCVCGNWLLRVVRLRPCPHPCFRAPLLVERLKEGSRALATMVGCGPCMRCPSLAVRASGSRLLCGQVHGSTLARFGWPVSGLCSGGTRLGRHLPRQSPEGLHVGLGGRRPVAGKLVATLVSCCMG